MERVLIVGGGTGGTMLANRLSQNRFEITVVSADAQHLFQPALLYVALQGAPTTGLVRPERRLLRRGVHLLHDRVTRVDLNRREVSTAGGRRLDYDHLVIATGVITDRSQIGGLETVGARTGDFHSNLTEAQKLWANLQAFRGGTIALGQSTPIIKCPPSPVEGILLIDALLRRRGVREKSQLIFFTPYPRPYPAEAINAVVEPRMRARGIDVRTVFDVDRVDPESGTITAIEGASIACDLPLLIPPFTGATIEYEPARVLTQDRLVKVDQATLRVDGFDNAFALGDASNVPTSKSGVAAHLEAGVVAQLLAGRTNRFAGRTHCPMDLGDGTGTFVIGSFTAPVIPNPPTRTKRRMKSVMGRIYWMSLRGWLEPFFTWYFRRTDPDRTQRRQQPQQPPKAA